jgi:hypothetical protein
MVDVARRDAPFAHPTLAEVAAKRPSKDPAEALGRRSSRLVTLAPQDDGNSTSGGGLLRYGPRFSECYYRFESPAPKTCLAR